MVSAIEKDQKFIEDNAHATHVLLPLVYQE